jgi:hypothetical protein
VACSPPTRWQKGTDLKEPRDFPDQTGLNPPAFVADPLPRCYATQADVLVPPDRDLLDAQLDGIVIDPAVFVGAAVGLGSSLGDLRP